MPTRYKYRKPSDQRILVDQEVYFSPSDQLNDPYDCQISIRQALHDAIKSAMQSNNQQLKARLEQFKSIDPTYEKIERDVKNAGVFSLATSSTNAVMWAHYAEDYKGFCIGFDLSEKFTTEKNDQEIIGTIDVHYSETNPFKDHFEEVAATGEAPSWNEFWMTLMVIGMASKSICWDYEKEVRSLKKTPGPVRFSPKELTEIVFGMNMSIRHREKIRKLLSGKEWKHVRFRETHRTEGFGVGIRDFTFPEALKRGCSCYQALLQLFRTRMPLSKRLEKPK